MWICLLIITIITSEITGESQLKQLHIVFRHGERTPTETYKNDPYINHTWPSGWGHLTNRGKLQMYNVGMELRTLYKDFIPELYSNENIEIMSSYADRCLMSAEALLAGLFPPKGPQIWNKDLNWQPIPIKYTPRSQDNLIAMKKVCKNYDEELAKVFASDEIMNLVRDNGFCDKLSRYTGEDMCSISKIELLYNTLEIERLNNLTLPEWTKNVSFDHLKHLATEGLGVYTHSDYMKRMKGGVFVNKTIDAMRNRKKPFIYLYSAHDITLVNILKTLEVTRSLKPDFAATFILEYHENDEIKMFYRDNPSADPVEYLLPTCGTPCHLNQFENHLKHLIPDNWENECGNN